MDRSTIVCRCEEINIDEIKTAIKVGASTFDDIKRLTRCGMGPCQSKVCMNLVRELLSESLGKPLKEIPPSRMRMPLKITRLGALVGKESSNSVLSVFSESSLEEGDQQK
ncbi:(2Fe-2S)-binding protein [Halobacillus naozhouensis]|uniref:(2Fe-2S)-binding protein n=1 Tax=Halobacillus naozhouensis TaxID=554880 RepID=A0ABY8IZV4_9BACI|nr:(2Fe-2S)-binding protein [Halobacillus naozhouensis]WFT74261.1 (2Fe-2S)-binding protein [Halobacillus naozhouensis]